MQLQQCCIGSCDRSDINTEYNQALDFLARPPDDSMISCLFSLLSVNAWLGVNAESYSSSLKVADSSAPLLRFSVVFFASPTSIDRTDNSHPPPFPTPHPCTRAPVQKTKL